MPGDMPSAEDLKDLACFPIISANSQKSSASLLYNIEDNKIEF
jgi:hypothetical protein